MKNIILFLIIFFGLISCHKKESQKLTDNTYIQEIFTKNEIKTLIKILDYFDSLVKESTKIQNIDSAYHIYCENLQSYNSPDELWNKLLENQNKTYNFIKTIENQQVFRELWNKNYLIKYKTDTIGYYLNPNINGKYLKLLNYLLKKDSIYISYKEDILSCGAIPPTLILCFSYSHKKFDFNDEVIRLFTALHFITINTYH